MIDTTLIDTLKILADKERKISYVFFWLKILHFTHKHYKTDYQMSLGDIFQSDNKHVLILVGYENKGERIFFIDPSITLK